MIAHSDERVNYAPMRIESVEAYKAETAPASQWMFGSRSWVFVVVRTENGHMGVGEASQSRDDQAVLAALRRWKDSLVGSTPAAVMAMLRTHLADAHRDRARSAAISALEHAMWDLTGKQCGMPVARLLGATMRSRVQLYANIGYAIPDPSADAYAATAMAAAAEGFEAVKIYPYGPRPAPHSEPPDILRWLDAGEERIAAVRAAIGPHVLLMVDLMHEMPNYAMAVDASRRALRYHPYWIEDPFPSYEPEPLRRLKEELGVPIAGGAPLLRAVEFLSMMQSRALDVLMPDVKWIGGIREARLVCDAAEAHGIQVSMHSASGPVSSLASAALALGTSWPGWMEYAWGSPPWRAQLTRGTEVIKDGYLLPQERPGLGAEIDIETLRGLCVDSAALPQMAPPAEVDRRVVPT